MTDEEVRHRREFLFALQQLLQRVLMFEALKNEDEDHLNFFRLHRGALMDIITVDWWKFFGNDGDPCHWKRLIPEADHEGVRTDIAVALHKFDHELTLQKIWKEIQVFRNNYVAHHNFDEDGRPQNFPKLTPLRLSAEVVYSKVFEQLAAANREGGFALPSNMSGNVRISVLEHWSQIAKIARQATADFENLP